MEPAHVHFWTEAGRFGKTPPFAFGIEARRVFPQSFSSWRGAHRPRPEADQDVSPTTLCLRIRSLLMLCWHISCLKSGLFDILPFSARKQFQFPRSRCPRRLHPSKAKESKGHRNDWPRGERLLCLCPFSFARAPSASLRLRAPGRPLASLRRVLEQSLRADTSAFFGTAFLSWTGDRDIIPASEIVRAQTAKAPSIRVKCLQFKIYDLVFIVSVS